jgi:hypothetical protein
MTGPAPKGRSRLCRCAGDDAGLMEHSFVFSGWRFVLPHADGAGLHNR